MRTYTEISRIIALAFIRKISQKGFENLSIWINSSKSQKKSETFLKILMRIRSLSEEGVPLEKICDELNLNQIDTLSQNILNDWHYSENIDPKEILLLLESFIKEYNVPITREEFIFFSYCNVLDALRKKMLE